MATTATTTVNVLDELREYQESEERAARINTAVHDFGVVVLQQANAGGSWGAFDEYCAQPEMHATEGGWTSEGYQPVVGDVCAVQHNPGYAGPDIQISVDVAVGPDGYTNQFSHALISTPGCSASVSTKAGIDISVGQAANPRWSSRAQTAAEAREIDNAAIKCLNETRP